MKKYILFLLLILVVVADIFIVNAIMVTRDLNIDFANSGYILKYTEDAKRYYFGENTTYKKSYDEKVVFKDTEGDKVVIDKNNFIHYGDGSISSFTKGALINLDEVEKDPITYYNFSANKVLKRLAGNKYIAKNLDKELTFTNIVWKISDSKYLISGTPMKIIFSDETEKEIDGYLEIEYTDNEVVKIYNQEVKYETISTDVYIQIGEKVKLNLGTKIISKDDKNEMSLENMVIDSNDNVNIVDLEEYKEEEEKDKEEDNKDENKTPNIQGGSSSSVSGGNISANGGSAIIGGTGDQGTTETPGEGNGTGNIGGDIETEVEDALSVLAPKYTVTEFKVSATGLQTTVEIEDEEARLTTGTTTSILNNATGKIVYSLPETGETQIKVDTSSLEPNTEYTLVMQASYAIDKDEYKKNFIYKVFRTPIFGITLEKDLFTDDSLSFNLKFDTDSTVSKLDVELVGTDQVKTGITNNNGNTEKIIFAGLTPDTEYTVQIKNVYIGNTSNVNTYSYTFKTLKTIPKLEGDKDIVQVEIDKWNGKFVLSIPGLEEGIVETLNYQIYTETEGQETLVYNKITTDKSIELNVDNETIQRNTDYICKVYATFYDNEKVVEYKIAHTETSFNMNSSQMPSIRFEKGTEDGITFNSIKGSIVIEDEGNTINSRNTKVEIVYNSTTKDIDDKGTLTFEGLEEGLEIPIDLKALKSNETYKFSVYATYDLHDGNGERYGYIGSIMITTKEPIPMRAVWSKQAEQGINVSLKLGSTGNSDAEAQSLYSLDLALYLGQEGASNRPEATTILKDSGIESFAASLKTEYYDKVGELTQEVFGLSDAQVLEIVENNKYCTIVIRNAKDYVSRDKSKNFENIIPIENFSYTYETAELIIKNPTVSEEAIKIEQIQKQSLVNTTYNQIVGTKDYLEVNEIISNNNINSTTTVAMRASANMSNDLALRYTHFEYVVYDENGNKVAESGLMEKNSETNEVPKVLFLISNGTPEEIVDTGYLARGNKYYFTYYAYTSENREGKYPTDNKNGEDFWENRTKPQTVLKKQKANVIMYPSKSTITELSYKYKITDLDNSIYVEEDASKYFHHFYAGNAIFEQNKQKIIEGGDDWNNVTFKLKDVTQKNYNLEVKIRESDLKNGQEIYTDLITQKFEDIINIENPGVTITENPGMYSTIAFNNLSNYDKEAITKIQVELQEKNNEIQNIVIEKNKETLEKDGWKIKINYLDIINKTSESLKGKDFNVNVKIYYINGEAGYEAINENGFLTYQTVKGKWLGIYGNKEFYNITSKDNSKIYPVVYNSHKYEFNDVRTLIKQGENEVSWLNYSPKGLVRNIESEENVSIIPKKVDVYENSVGTIKFDNVFPGIKSSDDLEIVASPTDATIKIQKLYTKDTIYNNNLFVDIYKEDDTIINTSQITIGDEGVRVTELEKGNDYYCKIYVNVEGNKVYIYDLDKQTNNVKYTFRTLDEVIVDGIEVQFSKSSIEEGKLTIKHNASAKNGFYGFKYEIWSGNELVFNQIEEISNYNKQTQKLEFVVDASRGSFFEYDTTYTIKVTPVIENDEGKIEAIGNTATQDYSYEPDVPEILVYARRVEKVDEENQAYIEWSISASDEDYIITPDGFEYEIYRNGDKQPIKEKDNITLENNYATIKLDKELENEFNIENAYTLKLYYKYYTSNRDVNKKTEVSVIKELSKIENGISIGNVSWKIEDDTNIKLKFYDSYGLSSIKKMKYSIYDINGVILNKLQEIPEVNIIEQNENSNDVHKSVTFSTNYTFETAKAYKIIVQFCDELGKVIATFEPENPETYNKGE